MALIDVGAASGATGAVGQLAGNTSPSTGSSTESSAGASADFRTAWQQILNALNGAGTAGESQATQKPSCTVSQPAGKPAASARTSGRTGKLSSNNRDRTGNSGSAASSDTALVAAAQVGGMPLPDVIKAPPASKSVLTGAQASPTQFQPGSIELAENGPCQNAAGSLSERESSPGLRAQSVQETAASDAVSGMNEAQSRSALSRPHEAQPGSGVDEVSDEVLLHAGDQLVQSRSGIAAVHPFAEGRSEAVNPLPDATRATHPAPLISQAEVRQVGGEETSKPAVASDSPDKPVAEPKHPANPAVKAVSGVQSAMRSSQSSSSVHPHNQVEAVNPLTTAIPIRSDGSNSLPARDRTQPDASGAVQDPFSTLDAHTLPSATWLQTGTHHAEAGFLDPALGWVGVRAQANGNALHATILPGSGEAAQALGAHLSALNSFVAEHHGSSSTVTLDSSGQGQMQGHSGAHSGDSSAQQQPHQEQPRGNFRVVAPGHTTSATSPIQAATNSDVRAFSAGGGTHISVIA
jgi:hypothetical protein